MSNSTKNSSDLKLKTTAVSNEPDPVFLKMIVPEAPSILVTLEQPDGTSQLIRLSEAEAEALGLSLSYVDEVDNSTEPSNEVVEKEVVETSESVFEVVQNVDIIEENQHLDKSQLQLVVNALQNDSTIEVEERESQIPATNFVYKVVYPEEFNLKPLLSKPEKRGRPKKRPVPIDEKEVVSEKRPQIHARTRSGRITRPPRHIEKDFKKIEIDDYDENEEDLTTTEFTPLKTSHSVKPNLVEPLGANPKKRNISSQYRCPKCQKAYLGRSRMLKHLQDFPDHGPIPQHCEDNNFETWNFLVDVTQKCSIGSRGKKFCEELTNLLHNLRLLTRVLFKTATDKKNTVKIDSVLGNALDLSPGNYKFNENELLKDVTVFTLLQSSKFFEETYLSDKNVVSESNKKKPSTNSEPPAVKPSNNNKPPKNPDFANLNLQNFNVDDKKDEQPMETNIELLSDNSLLNSLPNLRNSVDDLIMTGPNVLENNGHAHEVMNVDQFVNERFKNITEPEMELTNAGLNLDLPALDLFGFHTS